MHINANGYATFNSNTAQVQGGAIYIEFGSIIVNTSSQLLLSNNSAFQGGALYAVPSSFAITVGHQSIVLFTNNTAIDVGGAVYSEIQPAAPCLFMVTDSAAEISFVANHADHGVGHHMYGTSVRSRRCDQQSMA